MPTKPLNVLLVEDNPQDAELVLAALQQEGFAPKWQRVETEPDFLAKLHGGLAWCFRITAHRHEVALLLTDLVMPEGITGRDLGERLRGVEPGLPIVYMSGYSFEVAGEDFELKEDVNYLPKPFDLASLARIVRATLDRSDQPAA